MITGFLTFLFFFAIVGCVLYGRKLIRTEKVDAVFGNPERAKGGIHWVIVGSSFLLLIWLYYSWDIAKSFFPRSANELCQVGKVNESLLSLKYLFPIEERQLKSTSVIETETENLNKITVEIENVNIEALEALEAMGVQVYPQPKVLKIIKDKGTQKEFYKNHNIPSSSFEKSISEVW